MGGFARRYSDGGGSYAHRNRCLRVKAAFAGSVKFPAKKAFAARAAIPAAVVWLWGGWFGCGGSGGSGGSRGSGGSGGGGGAGGGGGGDARRSRRRLLVLCGDGSDSKKLLPPKTVSWKHLVRPVATLAGRVVQGSPRCCSCKKSSFEDTIAQGFLLPLFLSRLQFKIRNLIPFYQGLKWPPPPQGM